MGKKHKKDAMEGFLDLFFDTGHSKNARKSTHDKHTGANRNQGSGKPNSKSGVRQRWSKNEKK